MIGESTIAKALGVLSGTFLGITFDPPRSIKMLIRRCIVSLVGGAVFGHVVLSWAGWERDFENITAAWCISSLTSWWVMGRARTLIKSWNGERGET